MLTLDTLNVMLAVSEEGLIEEMIIALLASPQLAVFFEKFPRLKAAITDDVPRWREALRSRLKDAHRTFSLPSFSKQISGRTARFQGKCEQPYLYLRLRAASDFFLRLTEGFS